MTFPKEWVAPDKPLFKLPPRRASLAYLIWALDNIQVEDHGYKTVQNLVTLMGWGKARIFFIGNGGSAAIAMHMATDWQKNGRFATFGPGDCSLMSCYGNDYGFDHVYSEQIERHGQLGDLLFAISSSGMSENILRAVDVANSKMMNVITLSGFGEGNFLRTRGQVNFYVPSNLYGTVEIVHLAILHSILDEVIASEKSK
jgi:D-sedoheptulose 7-phosphate isomerase